MSLIETALARHIYFPKKINISKQNLTKKKTVCSTNPASASSSPLSRSPSFSLFGKGIEFIALALFILIVIFVFNYLKFVVMAKVFPPLDVEVDAKRNTERDDQR